MNRFQTRLAIAAIAGLSLMPGLTYADLTGMSERSKANGFLGKIVYAVFTRPAQSPPEDADMTTLMKSHLAYQKELEDKGIMFAAGPLSVEDVDAMGLIVYRAASLAEAISIADADPMHAHGVREYSIGQWLINEGTMTIKVNFSNGSYEFE